MMFGKYIFQDFPTMIERDRALMLILTLIFALTLLLMLVMISLMALGEGRLRDAGRGCKQRLQPAQNF